MSVFDEWATMFAPPSLRTLEDPPEKLYVTGDPSILGTPTVAIVGARGCSVYGRHMARKLARELAQQDITTVSGLARGVDTEAHEGSLDMGGATVAVLGTGIDVIYPDKNVGLAERILEKGGLIVSEHGPGVPPAPDQFPKRNRIIAGLCHVMVVVEARLRSGSMGACMWALTLNRPLLAFPDQAGVALSEGSNRLIQNGHARMCLSTQDVVNALRDYSLLHMEVGS